MNKAAVDLLEWEARLLLFALKELEERWLEVNRTSTDEDTVADVGNDLIQLGMLKDKLTRSAIAAFGDRVLVFESPASAATSVASRA